MLFNKVNILLFFTFIWLQCVLAQETTTTVAPATSPATPAPSPGGSTTNAAAGEADTTTSAVSGEKTTVKMPDKTPQFVKAPSLFDPCTRFLGPFFDDGTLKCKIHCRLLGYRYGGYCRPNDGCHCIVLM